MSSKYSQMGKNELRAACKAAGISYGKLNNDGMRAALAAKDHGLKTEVINKVADTMETVVPNDQIPVENSRKPVVDEAQLDKPEVKALSALTPAEETKPADAPVVNDPLGMASTLKTIATGKGKTAGMKIEKDREERNGVKRPSVGGMCRAVWDALDEIKATGVVPTAKQVTEMATNKGWNKNNASIEFYQWRKFNGIEGRAKKA